jgi:DNA-binding MarR family transcriptional regulator
MNQKIIGIILIVAGILLAAFVYMANETEEHYINTYISEHGSCFLEDGTCLHGSRDYSLYIGGWILASSLILLGIYLLLFDRTQQLLVQQNQSIAGALKDAKHRDEFNAFLTGFTDDEQKVLKAIRDQDGIKQSTLRYKAGISKAGLSLMLKDFEKKGIITRKEDGKTNQVFLRKKF